MLHLDMLQKDIAANIVTNCFYSIMKFVVKIYKTV